MITHKIKQGTPEWHAFRASHFSASDAPAMMGVSPHKTRSELLREKATGEVRPVSEYQQLIFDRGHRFEALARPLADEIVGDELYPLVGSTGNLSASFDGITLDGDVIFEHKTLNASLKNLADSDPLPMDYQVQVQHQFMVSLSEKCLFMATSWDDSGMLIGAPFSRWVMPDNVLMSQIFAGWVQFGKDLDEWRELDSKIAAVVGVSPDALPALHIEIVGSVSSSNLPAFRSRAVEVFRGIKTELQTDEDFADAEKTVKWCKDIETRLDDAKRDALAQTSSIDELFSAIDEIAAEARKTRLTLEKSVKAKKEEVKDGLVSSAVRAFEAHIDVLERGLIDGAEIRTMPDFRGAIAGLKSVKSIKDRLDTCLAFAKVDANEEQARICDNTKFATEKIAGHKMLFPDLAALVMMELSALSSVIDARTSAAKAAEEEKSALAVEIGGSIERGTDALADVPSATEWEDDLRGDADGVSDDLPPSMTLTALCGRLGFTVTADFMAGLGFEATKAKASRLYHERDFGRICDAIIAHIKKIGGK